MKIDELPVDILLKIFSYLICYDQVSLVNKHFYNVANKANPMNWYLPATAFKKNEHEDRFYQRIQNSNRNVAKLYADFYRGTDKQRKLLISIIKKLSATINQLRLTGALNLCEFIEILSLVPNVEHLEIIIVKSLTDNNQESQLSRNENLNLHQLRTLDFSSSDIKFLKVFNKLAVGVLRKIKISGLPYLDDVNDLFQKQTNVTDVDLRCYITLPPNIFHNMELQTLLLCENHNGVNFDVLSILSRQRTLKSLNLIIDCVDEDLLDVIANNLTELETFSLNISNAPLAAATKISELKKVTNLTLMGFKNLNGSLAFLHVFANLDNSRVFNLCIRGLFKMPDSLTSALATSAPNVKALNFECEFNYENLNATLRIFNFVEVLIIRNLKHPPTDNLNSLTQGDCSNPNLGKLFLHFHYPYETPFLQKLIANYPNLKKIIIFSSTPFTSWQFQLILDGFKKLESLSIHSGASLLTMNDLNYIKEHKNNLKFVSLKDLAMTDLVELKKVARATFDFVNVKHGFSMASDRHANNGERWWLN